MIGPNSEEAYGQTGLPRVTLGAFGLLAGILLMGRIMAFHAEFGRATAAALLMGVALLICVCVEELRQRFTRAWAGQPWAGRKQLIAWATIAVSAGLFFAWAKPAENVLGNHDQGMYVSAAFQIQRTGGTAISSPGLDAVPLEDRERWLRFDPVQFTRQEREARRYWSLGPGFVLEDQANKRGATHPHFPTGFPVFLAALAEFGGWPAVIYGNVMLTAMAGVLLMALAMRWFAPWVAVLAFPLFLFQPLVFWSANHLYAEPLIMVLWLGSVWALAEADKMPTGSGVVAGLCGVAALAVKVDAVGALMLMIGAGFLMRQSWRWWAGFLAALGIGGVAMGTSMSRSGVHYLGDTLGAIGSAVPTWAWIPLGVATGLMAVPRVRAEIGRVIRHPRGVAVGVSGVVVMFALLYVARPWLSERDLFYFEPAADWIPSYREETLRRLSWYWPWGGVLPLLAAGCVWFVRTQNRAARWLLLVGGAAVIFFAYDLRCNPLQPYAMRRFLPYGIPALCLSACAIAHWLGRLPWDRKSALAVIAWVVPALAGQVMVTAKIHRIAEHKGGFSAVERLAGDIPDGSVVLVSTGSPLAALSIPLRCIWGHEVYQIRFDKNDRVLARRLEEGVGAWHNAGRQVVVLDASARFRFNTRFTLTPLATRTWELEALPGSYTDLDSEMRRTRWRSVVSVLNEPPIQE